MSLYFASSVLVLALLLSLPMSRLIWVLSVRWLQVKGKRQLREEELQGQLKRARLIAVVVALIFSYIFNLYVGRTLGYG